MPTLSEIESKRTSQNGEDGILTFLLSCIKNPNHYFIEIGAGSGRENNSTNLVVEHGYCGLTVDRKISRSLAYTQRAFEHGYSHKVMAINAHVTVGWAKDFVGHMPCAKPDVFSIDIDSTDWHVVRAMLGQSIFQPVIMVVEYNAAFGTQKSLSIPYADYWRPRADKLIDFGCSIKAWHTLLIPHGYRFITVDSKGVNAFYARVKRTVPEALDTLTETLDWADCVDIKERLGMDADQRWDTVSHLYYVEV